MKKTGRQLDREIASALRKSKRHHATRKEDLWDVAMDALMEGNAKRAAKIVQEIRADDDITPAPITFYNALQDAPRDVRVLFHQLTSTSVYTALVKAGAKIDHHESDLYVLDTPEARRIIAGHSGFEVKPFKDKIDGKRWLEIPFAYDPFWDERAR